MCFCMHLIYKVVYLDIYIYAHFKSEVRTCVFQISYLLPAVVSLVVFWGISLCTHVQFIVMNIFAPIIIYLVSTITLMLQVKGFENILVIKKKPCKYWAEIQFFWCETRAYFAKILSNFNELQTIFNRQLLGTFDLDALAHTSIRELA